MIKNKENMQPSINPKSLTSLRVEGKDHEGKPTVLIFRHTAINPRNTIQD